MEPSMERAIGRMEGQLSSLNDGVSLLRAEMKLISSSNRDDYAEISAMVKRIDGELSNLSERVASVEPVVSGLRDDMSEVMPVARQIVRWRSLGAGVLISVTFVGSVFSGAIMSAKDKLIAVLFG